jgi:ribose transport system ATP-binding protein
MSDDLGPALRLANISKSFSGIQALSEVNLDLNRGEVHVLVGENGAGKSTLMKILSGAYERDSGSITIDGEVQTSWNPALARAKGVGMVYQEFNLVPERNVAENLFLGHELRRFGVFLDKAAMHRAAAAQLDSIGVKVDTYLEIQQLGVAQQQMVEIAKALLADVRFLVLDEPTSALTFREIDQLFSAIHRLKAKGVGIIYISHRMEELSLIGDRLTVLRDGRCIGTMPVAGSSTDQIIKMMIGREIKDFFPRHYRDPKGIALQANGICAGTKLKNVSLKVHYGEIAGLAGLMGAGRTEIARAIFGLDRFDEGSIEVNGKVIKRMSPGVAIDLGIGFTPEDRKKDGLFKNLGIRENIVMPGLMKYFPRGILHFGKEKKIAWKYVESLHIQPPDLKKQVRYMSGGNQQKVVMAKWLAIEPRILILDEPTRGIDVGAKAEINMLMDRLANEGNAVLMISSELPEVLGMSDRVYVMHEGSVVGEFGRNADSEKVIRCAMGVK